jgi:uncharacterized membrane protein YphA (DoxX/SURF4 family)
MDFKTPWMVHRILLGLLMLIPGLLKLFVFKPSGVTGMLAGMGFPAPMFFAWILILAEIVFGVALLANWKIKYTAWPPIVILVVATLVTFPWTTLGQAQWPTVLLHLVAISGYWMLAAQAKH